MVFKTKPSLLTNSEYFCYYLFYFNAGALKKMFTLKYDQKVDAKQDTLDQILKSCFPMLSTTTAIIDADTVQVTLPDFKFLPDGVEDLTHTPFTGTRGSRCKIFLWMELKMKRV